MAYNIGTGLAVPHETIPNLWVREIDQTNSDLILTGVVKTDAPGVAGKFLQTNTYSHGCMLCQVDGATNFSAQWVNVGTAASPSWKRFSDI